MKTAEEILDTKDLTGLSFREKRIIIEAMSEYNNQFFEATARAHFEAARAKVKYKHKQLDHNGKGIKSSRNKYRNFEDYKKHILSK